SGVSCASGGMHLLQLNELRPPHSDCQSLARCQMKATWRRASSPLTIASLWGREWCPLGKRRFERLPDRHQPAGRELRGSLLHCRPRPAKRRAEIGFNAEDRVEHCWIDEVLRQ